MTPRNLPAMTDPSRTVGNARSSGFSLPELLVSIAILSLLMVFTFQMMEQTQSTWSLARENTTAFKEARTAFEVITRRLSQATLNTYWNYDDPARPKEYKRDSELHFVVVDSEEVLGRGPEGSRPTHGVFFQAPLGFTAETKANGAPVYTNMETLVNAWGYFIEFSTDRHDRPNFLNRDDAIKERKRYRLMEFRQPSESLSIYSERLKDLKSKDALYRWFVKGNSGVNAAVNRKESLGPKDVRTVRPVAENIVALIIAPRLPEYDRNDPDFIAPSFVYDTRQTQWGASENDPRVKPTIHQLPPLLQVTMVAVDEADMALWLNANGKSEPSFIPDGLFKSQRSLEEDLKSLKKSLLQEDVGFRIFTTTIRMRESKWAENFDN